MKRPIKVGFSFGLTSGILTTLGLIVGLYSSTHSVSVIIGGILIITIADALSDATSIHIAEESEGKPSAKEIWQATVSTFFSKFVFASTFVIPILLFKLPLAIIISIIWGLSLLSVFSFYIAKQQKKTKPWKVITEHLIIAAVVIIITHYIGQLVPGILG